MDPAVESMQPCNNRGAEAHTCIPRSETSVYILISKEQCTNTIKVPVKLRLLIFILPLSLLSSVLQLVDMGKRADGLAHFLLLAQ